MTQKTKWLDLLINGDSRKAEAAKVNDQYVVMVPAANLVDASGSGQNTPAVQGHRAVFDKNGVLLGVDALGWNAEGGFYNTKWPSKADSIYNANAAKTYAPQVFQQMKKDGGWLTKFQNEGSTQPTQDQAMKELMAIVQQAATELQSNKPGQGVQILAQIANDPQGSQLLDTLVQQVPEAGQIVEAIMKMIGAFKCGGKTKKKVKKGAKGCVPCKKLMKVGGRLINVWSDCEGRIIHKNAKGGWIVKAENGIPGGFAYGHQNLLTFDDISKTTGQAGDSKYYFDPTTNQLMKTTWNATTNKWDAGQSTNDAITAGIGEGQVNLWKEGYNPETGLFTGETVTYTDKLGIKGKGYTTRAVENNNLVTINEFGNAQFSSVQGAETPYKNISYMPKAWRVNRALRDKRREQYYKDLLNGASVEDAKANKKIQKYIDKNFVYGRDLSEEAAAAISAHNSKNPSEQIYTVSSTGLSYKDLRKAKNVPASANLSSTQVVQPESNNVNAGASYVNPTKIRAAYRSKGGWLNKQIPKGSKGIAGGINNNFFGDSHWGSVSGNNLSARNKANKFSIAGSAASAVSALGGDGGNGANSNYVGSTNNTTNPTNTTNTTNNMGRQGGSAYATNGNTMGGSTYDNSNTASTAGSINNAQTDNRVVNNRQRNVGNMRNVGNTKFVFRGRGVAAALAQLFGGDSNLA